MNSLRRILSNPVFFAPAWVFSSLNILIGTWVLYLPAIKAKFSINDAAVGFALFFTSFGLLLSIPFVPLVNSRLGTGKATQVGVLLLALVYNIPLLAPTYFFLCTSLFFVGLLSGFTDVSMNALVAMIERREGKNFMSAAHGFFSLGGFFGAGVGSLFFLPYTTPQLHMFIVTSLIILSNLWLSPYYSQIKEVTTNHKPHTNQNFFRNLRPVFGLSVLAFVMMFNEGAVEHWSNLFLNEVVQAPAENAGYGFVFFSLTMTLGRFLGDGISQAIGSIKTLYYGSLVAMVGYFLILTANYYGSVLGFACLGLGLSVMVPEIFRLAGKSKAIPAAVAITTVSGVGFAGFLVGPVLLGMIANLSSLTHSYLFLLGSLLISVGVIYLVPFRE